ncbi:MAG: hypothetical protein ACHRHE_20675 [Tepidisphaerales bacterium]
MKRLLIFTIALGLTGGTASALVRTKPEQRMRDPLRYLANDMGSITQDLGLMKTGQPVQKKEQQVVAHLDELIKLLEKQCSGSGNGGSRNPTRPMNSSRIAGGPGGQGEMINARENGKEWGSLPPQLRQQILQSHTEGFPPGYEAILQSYYQRLAQEKTADGGLDRAASPTTRPTRP